MSHQSSNESFEFIHTVDTMSENIEVSINTATTIRQLYSPRSLNLSENIFSFVSPDTRGYISHEFVETVVIDVE